MHAENKLVGGECGPYNGSYIPFEVPTPPLTCADIPGDPPKPECKPYVESGNYRHSVVATELRWQLSDDSSPNYLG